MASEVSNSIQKNEGILAMGARDNVEAMTNACLEESAVEKSISPDSYAERVKNGEKKFQRKMDLAIGDVQQDSGKDGQAKVNSKTIEKVEDAWTLAGSQKVTSLVGSKKASGNLVGVERKGKENIAESVSEDKITGYIRENGVEVKSCYVLTSKIELRNKECPS